MCGPFVAEFNGIIVNLHKLKTPSHSSRLIKVTNNHVCFIGLSKMIQYLLLLFNYTSAQVFVNIYDECRAMSRRGNGWGLCTGWGRGGGN